MQCGIYGQYHQIYIYMNLLHVICFPMARYYIICAYIFLLNMHLRGQSDIFFRHFTESDLIQAKDHLLTLLSGQLTEGQRSALCLLQQLCRIDGKKISLLS